VAETPTVAAEAAVDRLRAAHDRLVLATADHDTAPRRLLAAVAAELPDDGGTSLRPRERVAIRLLRAGAFDAAWAVLRDNGVGVTTEELRANTSAGVRPTAWRLPLSTLVEPPRVFAWLPGFRDPRLTAPDEAYDVSDLVTVALRLDELWWDGPRLALAGSAYLRHLPAQPSDDVSLVLRHGSGAQVTVACERLRRPDLVTDGIDSVSRRAWTGWSARVDGRALRPSGLWKPSLRITTRGLERETRLAPGRGDAVPAASRQRVGTREATTRFADDRWLDLRLVDPLPVRATRRVLHLVARSAPNR
jgi:hypothetical protein